MPAVDGLSLGFQGVPKDASMRKGMVLQGSGSQGRTRREDSASPAADIGGGWESEKGIYVDIILYHYLLAISPKALDDHLGSF